MSYHNYPFRGFEAIGPDQTVSQDVPRTWVPILDKTSSESNSSSVGKWGAWMKRTKMGFVLLFWAKMNNQRLRVLDVSLTRSNSSADRDTDSEAMSTDNKRPLPPPKQSSTDVEYIKEQLTYELLCCRPELDADQVPRTYHRHELSGSHSLSRRDVTPESGESAISTVSAIISPVGGSLGPRYVSPMGSTTTGFGPSDELINRTSPPPRYAELDASQSLSQDHTASQPVESATLLGCEIISDDMDHQILDPLIATEAVACGTEEDYVVSGEHEQPDRIGIHVEREPAISEDTRPAQAAEQNSNDGDRHVAVDEPNQSTEQGQTSSEQNWPDLRVRSDAKASHDLISTDEPQVHSTTNKPEHYMSLEQLTQRILKANWPAIERYMTAMSGVPENDASTTVQAQERAHSGQLHRDQDHEDHPSATDEVPWEEPKLQEQTATSAETADNQLGSQQQAFKRAILPAAPEVGEEDHVSTSEHNFDSISRTSSGSALPDSAVDASEPIKEQISSSGQKFETASQDQGKTLQSREQIGTPTIPARDSTNKSEKRTSRPLPEDFEMEFRLYETETDDADVEPTPEINMIAVSPTSSHHPRPKSASRPRRPMINTSRTVLSPKKRGKRRAPTSAVEKRGSPETPSSGGKRGTPDTPSSGSKRGTPDTPSALKQRTSPETPSAVETKTSPETPHDAVLSMPDLMFSNPSNNSPARTPTKDSADSQVESPSNTPSSASTVPPVPAHTGSPQSEDRGTSTGSVPWADPVSPATAIKEILYPESLDLPFSRYDLPNAYSSRYLPRNNLIQFHGMLINSLAHLVMDIVAWLCAHLGPVPVVEKGKVRVRWTCRCGEQLYDDFVENRPGAVEELQKCLNHMTSYTQATGDTQPSTSSTFTDSAGQATASGAQPGSTQTSWSSTSFPSNATSGASHQQLLSPHGPPLFSGFRTYYEPLWLLTCAYESGSVLRLSHRDMSRNKVQSDKDMAVSIRKHYWQVNNKWYRSIRLWSLSSIEYVQFEVHRNRFADVRRKPDIPPVGPQHTGYMFERGDLVPPVGSNYLLHMFKHPEECDDERIAYDRTPKKSTRLDRGVGWGIILVEDFDVKKVFWIALVLFVLSSLAFGIAWTVCKQDIQGAFGVAGYILALNVFFVWGAQVAFD